MRAGKTVLAPNSEIAAAVHTAIERAYIASGITAWPTPQIRNFSQWARTRYEAAQFADPRAPRVLSDLEEREIWRQVVSESRFAERLFDPNRAADMARRVRSTMFEYGVPFDCLSGFVDGESEVLSQWLTSFDQRCGALHAIGADAVVAALPIYADPPVWIETPSWRPNVRCWLETRAGVALSPIRARAAAAESTAEILVHRAESSSSELAAAARWTRLQLDTNPQFRAWIYIPNLATQRAAISAAFDAALMPRRFSLGEDRTQPVYAIAGGSPLAGFAPVQIALATLTATVEDLSFAQFSALLREPTLQASNSDSHNAALLDVQLRRRGPSEAPLPIWLGVAVKMAGTLQLSSVSALTRLANIDRAVSMQVSSADLSRWAPLWIGALEAGPWADRAGWSSMAFQAAERMRDLIAELARANGIFGDLSKARALRVLIAAAQATLFQPQTGVTSIWVTGQAYDPWLSYDGIWIAGASEAHWPPPANPMPLLPVQLQREFGVSGSTAELQLKQSIDLQERWQNRTQNLVFSCSSDTGEPPSISGLVASIASHDIELDVNAAFEPVWQRLAATRANMQRCADDWGPEFSASESTRGVSGLKAQSLCAFRGFATARLATEPLEMPVPGFNAMERGRILHGALQSIWSHLHGSRDLRSCSDVQREELISTSVSAAISAAAHLRDPGPQWTRREDRRLRRLLARWLTLEQKRKDFVVHSLEGANHHVRHADLEFHIRIDRVDRLEDGSFVVIDYKTGSVNADWRGERPENPQLPIYALSLNAPVSGIAYAQITTHNCRFVEECDQPGVFKPGSKPTKLEGTVSMSELLKVWAQRIERIADALRSGAAQVAPTLGACRTCHLQGLCRISDVDVEDDSQQIQLGRS